MALKTAKFSYLVALGNSISYREISIEIVYGNIHIYVLKHTIIIKYYLIGSKTLKVVYFSLFILRPEDIWNFNTMPKMSSLVRICHF